MGAGTRFGNMVREGKGCQGIESQLAQGVRDGLASCRNGCRDSALLPNKLELKEGSQDLPLKGLRLHLHLRVLRRCGRVPSLKFADRRAQSRNFAFMSLEAVADAC